MLWYIDCRMEKQQWRNGWFDLSDKKSYFQNRPQHHHGDVPWTNLISPNPIPKKNIFLFGFDLMGDKTLPRNVGNIALSKYREMDIKSRETYELYPDHVLVWEK